MSGTKKKIILFCLLFAATVKQSNGMDINGCLSRPFLLGLKEAEGISVSCNSGSMTFEPCPQESRPGENLSWKDNPAGKYLSDLRSMRQQTLLQRRYHIAKSLYDVTSVEKKYPDDQIYLNLSGEGDLSSLSSPDLSHPLCDAIQESSITHIDISWNYLDEWNEDKFNALCDAIRKSNITHLNVRSNHLSRLNKDKFYAFCDAIQKSNITYLNVSNNNLSGLDEDKFNAFYDAIKNSLITHLNISWNNLDQKQILTFRQKLPNIKIIDDKYSSYAT